MQLALSKPQIMLCAWRVRLVQTAMHLVRGQYMPCYVEDFVERILHDPLCRSLYREMLTCVLAMSLLIML